MAIPVCVRIRDIEPTLAAMRVRLPGLGALQAFREDLSKLPDPGEVVGKFIAQLNQALSPLVQIADLLQVATAVLSCFQSVIDAITQLSPDPVVDCIRNLTTIINRILQYIPPFPYFIAIADILLVFINYLDEVARALADVDARITSINLIRERAASLQDANLQLIADCKQEEVDQLRRNAMSGMQALFVILGLIIGTRTQPGLIRMLLTLLPVPGFEETADRLTSIAVNIELAASGTQTSLGILRGTILDFRAILVEIYGLLARPVGTYIEVGPPPTVELRNL